MSHGSCCVSECGGQAVEEGQRVARGRHVLLARAVRRGHHCQPW